MVSVSMPNVAQQGLVFDSSYKGFPVGQAPCAAADIGARQWRLLDDALSYPLAVLRRGALQHNLQWMQRYATRKGVHLAPHGKTSMSPELFRLQLDAGAWGLSFATVHQLALGVAAGVRRAIIANQVLSPADLSGLQHLRAQHPDLQVWFLLDSLAQLHQIEQWFSAPPRAGHGAPFGVLLEVGVPGGRTGCRTHQQAMALARAAFDSPAVCLCGVECYEGPAARCDSAHDVAGVDALVRRTLQVVRDCDAAGLWSQEQVLLSAGGSAVFDLVLPLLQCAGLSRPVQGVLRSGCYLTHDHGNYRRYLQLVQEREGLEDSLQPALEVWALVQSVPEPGLALLGCGRRDISFDIEMPLPQTLVRAGQRSMAQAQRVPADWQIRALNDQHAFLHFDPAGLVPQVGDRVALGLSHPCTTFDKWRWLVLMEDDGAIGGAVHTCF